jgi:hypothetical protein
MKVRMKGGPRKTITSLNVMVKAIERGLWPTPTTQDASNNGGPSQLGRNSLPLNAAVGGALNPTFVEWLMGFPCGWTDLERSEMPSSHKYRK